VVLRSAFLVAKLHGFRPPGVGERDRADPWWVQLVELGPWAAVMAGVSSVAWYLIRERRSSPADCAGAAAELRLVAAAVAMLVGAVWATDGLSALVVGRREWADTVDAIFGQSLFLPCIVDSGSGVDVVAVLGFGVGAVVYLVGMIVRLAAMVLLAVVVPVMAADTAAGRSRSLSSRGSVRL
jgi:hypothetical protein